MAESGMVMMLRAMGVDPEGIKRDMTQFMEAIKAGVEKTTPTRRGSRASSTGSRSFSTHLEIGRHT